jgi:alkanesulfonate monooxygenase SsuD/methylene tetrahydromethanopterin reductase-like flavin-dependent oxidoreductase (luciferase family)
MSVQLGLFDILQVDPLDRADHATVYRRRLDDLALADELGYEIAFTAERHYLQHHRAPAPTAWIGAASQRTKRMRLGVLAYTLPLHSPVRLAEEVAVLDQLTCGRFEVGVGLGHRAQELVANGVDPANRIPIFQERLAVMEALWTGAQVTLESDYTTAKEIGINPLPVQEPHPPLWYAGVDQGAAIWAGNHGMSLAVGFAPLRDLVPATAGFKAGRTAREELPEDEIARPGAGRVALMQHVYLAESDERAFAEMREDLERLGELQPGGAQPTREVRKAMAQSELDRLLQHDIFLAGGPERVAQGIRFAQKALGIDLFLANVYAAGVDDERVRRTMRLLATDVRSLLADQGGSGAEG